MAKRRRDNRKAKRTMTHIAIANIRRTANTSAKKRKMYNINTMGTWVSVGVNQNSNRIVEYKLRCVTFVT
jgi:hypothetical protein